MTREDMAKEITGINAKLRWTHLAEHVRQQLMDRLAYLHAQLKGQANG